MVLSITNAAGGLNATSRGMLLSMRAHQAQMAQAQSRLATGLKVARPLDGPANYFTAAGARQRSDALDRLLGGFSTANSALTAAGNASTAIASLLGEMEGLVGQLNALPAPTPAGPPPPPPPPVEATPEADAASQALLDATGLTLTTDVRTIAGASFDDASYSYAFSSAGTPSAHRWGQDGWTVGDLLNTINTSGGAVTASLSGGRITLTADTTGDAIGFRSGSAELASTGLQGSYYEGNTNYATVDAAEALIDPANLVTTFTATTLDYPNGNQNDNNYDLGTLLGSDAASLSDPAMAADYMVNDAMVLEGNLQVATAGTYSLYGFANEHLKITIDGVDVLKQEGKGNFSTNVTLTAGSHDIRILYFDNGGQKGIEIASSLTGGYLDTSVLYDPGETPTFDTTLAPPPPPGGTGGGGGVTGGGATTPERSALLGEIGTLREQIGQIVRDARFGGVNFADGGDLDTILNERGTRLEKTFTSIDADGLGLTGLSDADFQDADLMESVFAAAREKVEIHAIEVSATQDILDARKVFSVATIETLRDGADELTLADPNAEGAKLLAAQTRLDLASEALSIAATRNRGALTVLEIAMDRGLIGGGAR